MKRILLLVALVFAICLLFRDSFSSGGTQAMRYVRGYTETMWSYGNNVIINADSVNSIGPNDAEMGWSYGQMTGYMEQQ